MGLWDSIKSAFSGDSSSGSSSSSSSSSSSKKSGLGGYGTDSDNDGRVSIKEWWTDATDGGGAGKSGDSFGGLFGGVSNALGATPRGSDRDPTGLAGFMSKATGIGAEKVDPSRAALLGIVTGGIPGAIAGAASAVARNAIDNRGGLGSILGGQGDVTRVSGSMETSPRPTPRPSNLMGLGLGSVYGGGGGRNDTAQPAATPEVAPAPTVPLDMSAEAAKGQFSAIPNPDYDPTNPMSSRFLLNPTYEQLLAYRNYQLNPTGGAPSFTNMSTPLRMGMNYNPVQLVQPPVRMAEGGEVSGRNEKAVISDAISAVKGAMPEEQAAMALGMFVQTYGRDALADLVERVKSGEFDDTVSRSEGKLEGPGDGMNDRIPASIDGEQDVLLSDGEFIIPADVVSGLGNGSSDAGAKELERFMTRVRVERSGKADQPDAVDPADVLPV